LLSGHQSFIRDQKATVKNQDRAVVLGLNHFDPRKGESLAVDSGQEQYISLEVD
jgi:hypothetical protein